MTMPYDVELQVQFLPAVFGVGGFILFRLLSWWSARPQRKKADAFEAEPLDQYSAEPGVEEPLAEPEVEDELSGGEARPKAQSRRLGPFQDAYGLAVFVAFLVLLAALANEMASEPEGVHSTGPARPLPRPARVPVALSGAGRVAPVAHYVPPVPQVSERDVTAQEPVAEPVAAVSQAPTDSGVAVDAVAPVSKGPLVISLTRQQVVQEDLLDDFVRSAYFGTLMIGSPPEPFTVVFDTGSGHLVLPSTYCKSDTCKLHKRYRPSASATGKDIDHDGSVVQQGASRDQISVSFGTGEVTGVFVEDIICVEETGSQAWIAMTNGSSDDQIEAIDNAIHNGELPKGCVSMRMIAATSLSEDPFASFEFDGILGLGLSGLSQTDDFNFINVVARSVEAWGGSMPHTFGVFLADSLVETSEIALGGWDQGHLREELSWGAVPDPEMGHWLLKIRGMHINNEVLPFCTDGTCMAAVDTGTSLLAVPTAVFPELYEQLKHPTPLLGHCEGRGPLLHIEFDDFTVTLGPKEYAAAEPLAQSKRKRWQKDDSPYRKDLRCNPMLMTLDLPEPLGPKLFVLGEPVLRKYYTVYDGGSKRIGFGRAKHSGPSTRGDFLMSAALPKGRKTPTMFEIFRWRRANRFRL